MTDRVRRIALAVAIGLALVVLTAVRVRVVGSLRDQGWLVTYVHLADEIVAGHHPAIGDVSPVYLWLMVLVRSAGFAVATVRAMQIAALTLAALFCALAAHRIAGWIAALATAILILGNRAALVVCSELDPKAFIFLLTSAALFCIASARGPRSRSWLIAAGALLGLSAATHPYGYVLLFLLIAWSRRVMVAVAGIVPIVLVLVLSPVQQHAGSQLYEGNNPLATGCAGVAPRVVAEMQTKLRLASPDPVYRRLAEIAGAPPNGYWRGKAVAFMRAYPRAELRLLARKALLTVHHFDVHDIVTAQRRSRELARFPAIPFGVSFVLAVVAFLAHSRRRDLVPYGLFALALMLLLTLFVVSARQRNVLLAPLSILGGVGIAEIVALARARSEAALLAFGAVIIAVALLGIESAPMTEYDHQWRLALRLPVEPDSPATKFDQAIALERAGKWREADALLASLGDYQPLRQSAAVASVAYYRARAALASRVSPRELLDRATREAPGDPHVLALRTVTIDPGAARILDQLHDPLTRDAALRRARSLF